MSLAISKQFFDARCCNKVRVELGDRALAQSSQHRLSRRPECLKPTFVHKDANASPYLYNRSNQKKLRQPAVDFVTYVSD